MTAIAPPSHFEWNEIGYDTRLAVETRHKGYTLTRGSVHLLIECLVNELQVRLVVFGERGKRSIDDVLPFTPNELRTALNLRRNGSQSDAIIAGTLGAEFAGPHFARRDNRLKIHYNGSWFYFFLYPSAQIFIGRYMDYHFHGFPETN